MLLQSIHALQNIGVGSSKHATDAAHELNQPRPPFEGVFNFTSEKSPKRVSEHRHAKENNGKRETDLIGKLRGVIALGFVGHGLHLS
jgi:hypothetical protein